MKTKYITIGYCLLWGSLILAQIPKTINIQGVLTNSAGELLEAGEYEITFAIYNQETGETAIWQEQQTVPVQDGLFNVNLGVINELDIGFDEAFWVGLTLSGESELIPRIKLTASPYSLRALSIADSAITSSKIANGTAVRSINGKTEAVNLAAGPNIQISETANTLVVSAVGVGSGDVTAVLPGDGLSGGGTEGDVTIGIADNGITANKIAEDEVAKSINDLHDDIKITAIGGAMVSTSGDSIIINAGPGGTGEGIQSIQNTDGTLNITEPTGPTATINIKPGSIDTIQIADSSITQTKIASDVTLPPSGSAGGDLGGDYPTPSVTAIQGFAVSDSTPTTGQVLKWSGDKWQPSPDEVGSTVWSTSATNNIFYNGGDVGIGTNAPDGKLELLKIAHYQILIFFCMKMVMTMLA